MTAQEQLHLTLNRYAKPLNVALGERDLYTRSHCARVVAISEGLGRECGFVEAEIEMLKICASFHDIGKIGIPDSVLLKPGRFNDAEWEVMQAHPEIGERIIRAIAIEGAGEVADAVRHHHEHFDGGGYPDRLSGEAIPIYARVISLADGYDALRTVRTYHRERTHAEVIDILRGEQGGKYDPWLFGKFVHMPAPESVN